jgi:hypothetical protein
MKRIRWTNHALQNLVDREIERSEAERVVAQPEFVVPDPPGRQVWMRRYFDQMLQQDMLLRVVVEETASEIVVVTIYKTSQISRYLEGLIS